MIDIQQGCQSDTVEMLSREKNDACPFKQQKFEKRVMQLNFSRKKMKFKINQWQKWCLAAQTLG